MRDVYLEQVRLLVSLLPLIAEESSFALKGGTAINLFHRAIPRLSVDIDLVYVPIAGRDESLRDINQTFDRIADNIREKVRCNADRIAGGGNQETRILVARERARVKIETSPVLRGTLYPPVRLPVNESVADRFGFAETNVVAWEDLYGSKMHAALDRQHPRDLFDIGLLYEGDGINERLFNTFLVYLASSRRPVHELLAPGASLSKDLLERQFAGMTEDPVSMESLESIRLRLHSDISRRLTGDVATFLLSLHDAEPRFDLIGLPGAAELPAVRWKLRNLEKLRAEQPRKYAEQRQQIERLFI